MMETHEHPSRQSSGKKIGRLFLGFGALCLIAMPFVVWSASSYELPESASAAQGPNQIRNFDENGNAIFESYDRIVQAYLEGVSSERTLEEYYSRRQYPGSPPFIPHKIEDDDGAELACATCHVSGGWTEELKRHTPVTPHPEHTACQQCHVPEGEMAPFVDHQWVSVRPPQLGRSHLPGAPPPIPHQLQMRGNCVACHVGPGTVSAIRVQHPMRGNCRQCHVPDSFSGLFERESDY